MMTFTIDDVFSDIYKAANALPIEKLAESIRFGDHKSRHRGDGHDFDRVVEYDPQIHTLAQIDWRSRDLNGHVYVREYKVTKDFPVIVVNDLSTSMAFGIEHQHKERMLLEVFGSLGLACFRAQDPMGLIGFAEDIIFHEQPKVGEDQVYYLTSQLYEFFMGLESDGGGKLDRRKTDFYNVFDFIRKTYSKRCLVVIVSDFVDMDNFPGIEVLNDITSHHEMVFVLLDDPSEFAFGGLGYIRQEDLETGQTKFVSRLKAKKNELKIRLRRKQFRKEIQAAGIDSIVLEYGKHLQRLYRFFIARYESFKT